MLHATNGSADIEFRDGGGEGELIALAFDFLEWTLGRMALNTLASPCRLGGAARAHFLIRIIQKKENLNLSRD